jgi:hypothetical protein
MGIDSSFGGGMMAKKRRITKAQSRKLLFDAHAKFLKLFSTQQLGENYVTPEDLQAMLKIVNRVNKRML